MRTRLVAKARSWSPKQLTRCAFALANAGTVRLRGPLTWQRHAELTGGSQLTLTKIGTFLLPLTSTVNAALPLTASCVTDTLDATRAETVGSLPYRFPTNVIGRACLIPRIGSAGREGGRDEQKSEANSSSREKIPGAAHDGSCGVLTTEYGQAVATQVGTRRYDVRTVRHLSHRCRREISLQLVGCQTKARRTLRLESLTRPAWFWRGNVEQ